MRRKTRLSIRRKMSGSLACLLTAISVLSTSGAVPTMASESKVKMSYKQEDVQKIGIHVEAENESFGAGETMLLNVYIQNNSGEPLKDGTLKWVDKKETLTQGGFLFASENDMTEAEEATPDSAEEIGEAEETLVPETSAAAETMAAEAVVVEETAAEETAAPEETVAAETAAPEESAAEETAAPEETAAEETAAPEENAAETEIAGPSEETAAEAGPAGPSEDIAPTQAAGPSSDNGDDFGTAWEEDWFEDEDADDAEIEGPYLDEEGNICNIDLAPGEIFTVQFAGTIDEDIYGLRNRDIRFTFGARKPNGKRLSNNVKFQFNTGLMTMLPVEFEDGNLVETNEENTMTLRLGLDDIEYMFEEIEKEKADEATPSEATPSETEKEFTAAEVVKPEDAATPSEASKATPSEAEETKVEIAAAEEEEEENEATPSEAKKEEDEEDEEDDENNSDGVFNPEDVKYSIETYGVRLKGVKARFDEDASGPAESVTEVSYRVASGTEPGLYFGTVTASVRYNGNTYKSVQGFHINVTGEGQMALRGKLGDAEIIVSGDPSSFGAEDHEILSIQVTEVPVEKEEMISEAMEKKAEETGVAVEKMKAMDIKVIADGEVKELEGPVTVTFAGLELEEVKSEAAEAEEKEEKTLVEQAVALLSLDAEETVDNTAVSETNTAVWHLDEDAVELNEMDSYVNEDGDVVMETDHFSVFVIVVQNTTKDYNLIFEHRLSATGEKQYKDTWPVDTDGNRLKVGLKYTAVGGIERPGNYQVKTIDLYKMKMRNGNPVTEADGSYVRASETPYKTVENEVNKNGSVEINIDCDTIAVLNYEPKTTTYKNTVTFYDYDYSGTDKNNDIYYKGINNNANYDSKSGKDQRLGIGLNVGSQQYKPTKGYGKDHAFADHDYRLMMGNQLIQNGDANGGANSGKNAIRTGIVSKLKGTNYETVVWGKNADGKQIYDPGLFTNGTKTGKRILTNYNLEFKRKGDTYTLQRVRNTTTQKTTTATTNNNFFPLDEVDDGQFFKRKNDTKAHNWFFGMRYDFKFTLGDYIGDLTYTFTGDDDVWVFLDGQLILDLGGIHTLYPDGFIGGDTEKTYEGRDYRLWRNTVNLWHFLNGGSLSDYTADAKYDYTKASSNKYTKEHQITVLYMERGGYDSNCSMNFVIPDIKPLELETEESTTSVTVEKQWNVDADKELPSYITVQLLQGDSTYGSAVTIAAANNWTYTWNNLPVYKPDGKKYEYSVNEVNIPGYNSHVQLTTGDGVTNPYKIVIDNNQIGDIAVRKEWDDGNNKDNSRPKAIKVQLYKTIGESTTEEGEPVILQKDGWSYTWKDKELYTNDGVEIVYSVKEIDGEWSKWYSPWYGGNRKEGFTITNTYVPETVSKRVTKVWEDGENRFELRPEKITVALYQGETKYDTAELIPETWAYDWSSLPKYKYFDNGKPVDNISRSEYVYTISELSYGNQDYYTTAYAPADTKAPEVTITNTLKTAKFRVAKRIDNINDKINNVPLAKNDLAEDEFLIRVKGGEFSTGFYLKHAGDSDNALDSGELSPYIEVPVTEQGATFKVSEVVPKEYDKEYIYLTMVGGAEGKAQLTDDGVKVMAGADDVIVIVHNKFDHDNYFHHDESVDNEFPKDKIPEEYKTVVQVNLAAVLPGSKEDEKE